MNTPKIKVFVSMPFTGKTWEDLTEERNALHALGEKYGLVIVEQFIGYQGKEDFENKDYNPSFILAKDKNFIKEADVVVADFSSSSIGTDCEVTIAKELFDKKVYAVVPKEKRRHMWLIFYCDHFLESIEDAFRKVKEDFRDMRHVIPRADKRQYDPIAVEYRLVEETPAQKFVYDPAVTAFLTEHAKGRSAVVLHAGSGYRARLAKKVGVENVTGIEISYKQTQIARNEEMREPLGITYFVSDPFSRDFITSLPPEMVGTADVVLGCFLLDHAMTSDELNLVARNIHLLLRPGGFFFGLSDHPDVRVPTDPKYGVAISFDDESLAPVDGTPRRISIYQKVLGEHKEVLHFHNFLWQTETVQNVLSSAGFSSVQFAVPDVSEEGKKIFGDEFWQKYSSDPTTIIIQAKKG